MYSNVVYGHAEWAEHKSSWRHARHFLSIVSSGLIRALAPPVVLCTSVAVMVSVINYGVMKGLAPSWLPLFKVATVPFSFTAPVLALLLVFRTNTSYHRFDEARRAWGSNVTRSRDLARQSLAWVRHPSDTDKLQCLLRYIKALSFCMKHHLMENAGSLEEDLIMILENRDEVENVMSSMSRPLYVLQVISEIINQCQIPDLERITMDRNITQCHDNLGACDRIFKTPIPVAYTRLVSRVLTLWHLVLPFALWESCGWLTILASFVSSAALFYIEQVGVVIEEPFSILALASMAKGVLLAIDGLLSAHTDALILAWTCKRTYEQKPSSKGSDHVVINLKCPSANDMTSAGNTKLYIRSLSVSQLQSIPSSIDI
ncbi:hypothetical protein KC19_3G226300 [Ceratodon purpureus]|uniref:Uncharacterized protein n=1 Tax=Ceratodon purpureus TaxID=3225 RepID=A0A8T0INS9_CERPU|nr:hypothetical protein KC19_3G226300 [Ceratodon purpureus]